MCSRESKSRLRSRTSKCRPRCCAPRHRPDAHPAPQAQTKEAAGSSGVGAAVARLDVERERRRLKWERQVTVLKAHIETKLQAIRRMNSMSVQVVGKPVIGNYEPIEEQGGSRRKWRLREVVDPPPSVEEFMDEAWM